MVDRNWETHLEGFFRKMRLPVCESVYLWRCKSLFFQLLADFDRDFVTHLEDLFCKMRHTDVLS